MSMDEDFYVPTKNGRGTKIETLPGATNLGEIEDVRYFRDKLLACLKVPKDYLVEKDKSPERKANLSQLDVKFARTIQRIQVNIETGLENMAKRHLQLRGFPASLVRDLRIKLPEPSDMSEKRKLDVNEQKVRVVQAAKGLELFSTETIYKQFYNMTDEEIRMEKAMIEDEKKKAAEMEASMAPPAAPGAPPAPGGAPAAGPGPGEAGGQEPAENAPPTAESVESTFAKLIESTTNENDRAVLERILEKQRQKAESANHKESI